MDRDDSVMCNTDSYTDRFCCTQRFEFDMEYHILMRWLTVSTSVPAVQMCICMRVWSLYWVFFDALEYTREECMMNDRLCLFPKDFFILVFYIIYLFIVYFSRFRHRIILEQFHFHFTEMLIVIMLLWFMCPYLVFVVVIMCIIINIYCVLRCNPNRTIWQIAANQMPTDSSAYCSLRIKCKTSMRLHLIFILSFFSRGGSELSKTCFLFRFSKIDYSRNKWHHGQQSVIIVSSDSFILQLAFRLSDKGTEYECEEK